MASARMSILLVCLVISKAANAAWQLRFGEDFQTVESVHVVAWRSDAKPADGPFSDTDDYFGGTPPSAFRLSSPLGQHGWLMAESYTRDENTVPGELLSIVEDPQQPGNRVLRLRSPQHTDASIVRSAAPLPARYRISLRVGYPQFGDGQGLNGYHGDELAEPWADGPAISENGFYWLAILDTVPRPRNHVWLHHHRKAVIDSDNHHPPWMQIWDGNRFVDSGRHPIMMFVVDGRGAANARTGKPFISYSAGAWQPSGLIRAVDRYLPNQWYEVSIERGENHFRFSIRGKFAFGGQHTYTTGIDYRQACVWHYNLPGQPLAPACRRVSAADWDAWDGDGGWPDYFFFGDPHVNYYEGEVHYDDIRLEVWVEPESTDGPDASEAPLD
jgi:hypothetical protein